MFANEFKSLLWLLLFGGIFSGIIYAVGYGLIKLASHICWCG